MTISADAPASPIDVVEAFMHALVQMDLAATEALLHDEVVYQNVPFPPAKGRAATMRTLRAFTRLVSQLDVKMVHIAANGPVVLTERVDTLSGPWVHLELWVCGTFEVRDGRIVLWRDYFDSASATAQLALGPLNKLARRVLGAAGA